MSKKFNRRGFLRGGLFAGVGLALGDKIVFPELESPLLGPAPRIQIAKPMDVVRIGIIGVGGMGSNHLNQILGVKGAELRAICDVVEAKAVRAQKQVEKATGKKPDIYTKGDEDFKNLCDRDDLDLVYIATPWEWHVPMALKAMKSGKHVAVEVPAAVTMDDCWKLVDTSEKTGKYCCMMENCCYDREEMQILNMVKKGVFGEILHAECGYLHDLRGIKLADEGEGLWRRDHSIKRDGDLYPTHGLGPIAQCMDINRGNRFDYLVSVGCKSRGLDLYADAHYGKDSPKGREVYALSDIVTTIIKTHNEETIVITHDTNTPRPYSRDILVQGTKGIARKYPSPLCHIEGKSPAHRWEPLETYKGEYWHPVWKKMDAMQAAEGSEGMQGGHGGMDYVESYRLINALLKGIAPDMDVYDAAALSVVSELSERSIAAKGKPMQFPDFTRGNWKKKRPLQVMLEK